MENSTLNGTLDFLRRHAPFNQMEDAHLEFLAKRLEVGFYARGQVVMEPSEGAAGVFHIIRQGRVRGGEGAGELAEQEAWELVSGECFPIGALLSRRPVRFTTHAVEDTLCFELGRESFMRLLQMSSVFHDFCTRRMASLLDNAYRDIQARSVSRVSNNQSLDTPLRSMIPRTPLSVAADTPIEQVLQCMARESVGSMVVCDAKGCPTGMFTLNDVLRRVALPRLDLASPISAVANAEFVTLPPDAAAFDAVLALSRQGADHLCVVDSAGVLVGVLSERDLFSLQRIGLVGLNRAISTATDIASLAAHARQIHILVEQMIAQGASVEQLTHIITDLNDAITLRVIELTLETQDLDIPFTWLSFGSEGRGEQTLKTDQDNGILFATPEGMSEEQVRERLLPVARKINEALDQCGFPLCPGNIMASNPDCCLSYREWQARFSRWIDQGSPEHLLYATIYFDYRVLYGDTQSADELRQWLTTKVRENSRFRRQMAANAMRLRPPLGLLRDFVLSSGGDHPHTLDLKTNGITPFVDAARIYAFACGVPESNTLARLRAATDCKGGLREPDVAAWCEAYNYIQLLRLRAHRRQAEEGQPLSNHIDPDSLNELDRRILKEAFRQARKLQSKLTLEYQL